MKRFLFLLVLLCTQVAWAKTDTKYNELKNAALIANAPLSVSGQRYNNGVYVPLNNRTYWIEKAYGLVKLSVPVSTQAALGTASVIVNVSYTIEENNAFVVKTENNITLSVVIGAENATDASYFLAPDAQNVQVQIVSVSNPGNLTGLTLSASAVTESFDYMTFSNIPAGLAHTTVLTAGGSLPVSWKPVAAAETYELEWTYISNQGATPATTLAFNQLNIPPFYFRNNSSRVEVTDTLYQIPLVYEKGYILYRVRAVGKSVVNSTAVWVKSNWTYLDNGTEYPETNAYLYDGLENNLNWLSSLSFAEEGKHKVVVSYHDGSSRNRQAVTRINTDGRAVVGETLYDYNGRPVIQTLPVPVHKDSLGYYPHFNVVDNKTVLTKEDVLTVSPDACNPVGPALSDKTGASRYYSPLNDFKPSTTNNTGDSIINRELIPDAKKYPYSQTVYTPDNTGRIAKQSGMGETNRLGSTHETQYLYATPLQSELCRLFGSQVGYAAHYKKNTVIDPNGQVSVSYLDLDGKVVATALAGGAPDNVSSLGNNNTRSINEDIIKTNPMSNELSRDTTSRTFNKKFAVTSNTIPYIFNYTGSFGYYNIPCKTAGTYLSIDGVIDVTVTLKDKCGAVVFSTTKSTVQGNSGNRQTVATGNIPATLSTGEYQLTKVAEINEDKLAAYTQDYLASTCAKQLADFKAEEIAKINYADCNLTCASCKTEVARLLLLTYLTDEQKEDIKNMCASICDESIGCSASLSAMKGDMSPNGQYAELRVNRIQMPQTSNIQTGPNGTLVFANLDNISINHDNTNAQDDDIQPQLFPLSIFNPSNKIPLGSYLSGLRASIGSSEYWRYPIKITKTGDNVTHPKNYQILNDGSNPIELTGTTQYSIGEYLDEKGDTAFIYVQKKVTLVGNTNVESYSPEIAAGAESKLKLVDANLSLYKIPVRYLNKVADFENNWKSHWAYALLPYHPEFPYYIACIAQNASNDFDYKLMNTSFADAKQQGFIQSNGTPSVFAKETALSAHVKPVAAYTAWMNTNTTNYQGQGLSMALLANRLTNCPTGTAETNACGAPAVDCNDIKIDTELEWSTYRSLYFSVKQKFLKNVDMIRATDQGYYNGCIGHANYISSPEAWYFDMPKAQTVSATVRSCPRYRWFWNRCGWRDITYTAYIPAFLIQSQICYIGNAGYLKEKAQRFYPTGGLDNGVSQQTGNCPEVTYNEQGQPLVSLVACADDLTALKNAADAEQQRLKYEMCGLCPLASDVESLLIQLTANNKLITASTTISCSNDPIELGEALRRSILGSDITNPVLYWASTVSADKKTVTGSFRKGAVDIYTLTLAIADTFTTDHLLSVCCLTVKTGNTFQLKATFKKGNKYKDVWLNGIINLDLKSCNIPPKCVLTEDASNTANLLNILSVNNHLTPASAVHLFDGISSTGEDDGNNNINKYFDVVLSLLRITDASVNIAALTAMDPTWSATNSGGVISGTLNYTIAGTPRSLLIEITLSGSPVVTTLIHPTGGTFPDRPKQFNSLSPVSYTSACTSGCGTEFGISILYSSGNQFYAQKAVISVPLLVPVKCSTVIPATVSRQ